MRGTINAHPPITAQPNPADAPDLARTKAAAREFEAMFIGQMLEPMFDGLATDGPFGGGNSEEAFRSLLVGEYAREVSKRSPIGVADQMVRSLLQAQESSGAAADSGMAAPVPAATAPAAAPEASSPGASSPLSRGA
jgi:Rod binding domain-containing protein